MKLHPQCLQDGKFLAQFYIQHYNDNFVNLNNKHYWLEYHSNPNQKTLVSQYHLIPPTSVSLDIAQTGNLVPFCEWIYLLQSDHLFHGPFNFAMLNNHKTRDHIATTDWNLLIAAKDRYNCPAPQFWRPVVWRPVVHIITTEQ
jgi:hypothetical protein